jgi:glyoxylase-like metal-dependent hydrolase (beta-lactamase superfamily II)
MCSLYRKRQTVNLEVHLKFKMQNGLGIAVALATTLVLLSGVAVAQDAKTVADNATKAMGYDKLNTIQYSGSGFEGTGAGQLQSIAAGWPKFTEKNYVRFIDYTAGTSTRTSLQSRPSDPKTGLLPGGGGLDPGAEASNTANIAANANWAAKTWINLSPPGFLRLAAAASTSTVKHQSIGGKNYTVVSFPVEAKAPSGVAYSMTGFIDDKNMVTKVQTWIEEPVLIGDMLVEDTFGDYKSFDGVQFPTSIVETRAGLAWNQITITDVKPNAIAPLPPAAPAGGGGGGRGGAGGAGGGAPGGGRGGAGGGGAAAVGAAAGGGAPGGGAPGGGAPAGGGGRGGAGGGGAAAGGAPGGGAQGGGAGRGGGGGGAAATTSKKLGDGVYQITSGYRSVAIEFKDYVVVIDAPQAGFDGTLAEVKKLFPNKPIKYVVALHNHYDHEGSLRTAVAEGGMTIVAQQMDKQLYPVWFSNPRTLSAPDKLAQAQADAKAKGDKGAIEKLTPKFKWVGEKLVMKDASNTLELFALHGAVHGEDMLVAYLPKVKTIVEADAYNPGAAGAVTGPNNSGQAAFQKLLASEMDRLMVDYNFIISGHAPAGGERDVTKADLMKAIGKASGN